MVKSPNCEPISIKHRYDRSATRFTTNRNWCWRGDNTKYKEKK